MRLGLACQARPQLIIIGNQSFSSLRHPFTFPQHSVTTLPLATDNHSSQIAVRLFSLSLINSERFTRHTAHWGSRTTEGSLAPKVGSSGGTTTPGQPNQRAGSGIGTPAYPSTSAQERRSDHMVTVISIPVGCYDFQEAAEPQGRPSRGPEWNTRLI